MKIIVGIEVFIFDIEMYARMSRHILVLSSIHDINIEWMENMNGQIVIGKHTQPLVTLHCIDWRKNWWRVHVQRNARWENDTIAHATHTLASLRIRIACVYGDGAESQLIQRFMGVFIKKACDVTHTWTAIVKPIISFALRTHTQRHRWNRYVLYEQ